MKIAKALLLLVILMGGPFVQAKPPAIAGDPASGDRSDPGAVREAEAERLQLLERFSRARDRRRQASERDRAHYRKTLDTIHENSLIIEFNSAWMRDLVENWDCRFAEASLRELVRRRGEVQARLDRVRKVCRDTISQTPGAGSVCIRAQRENELLLAQFDRLQEKYSASCQSSDTLNRQVSPLGVDTHE
uniref:Lysozyme inhibitor LprI N-terminal domain-containing protein n=1 Tax=Candidatus Kentrum sp. MB TaxID=2138164 RepID=A0A451B7X6_9GAMM|nr:MAG: hypothetical protein BECKMB1821G_GA0114241_100119 [Candidatus Kentron sp. MB]VFK27632.1 MAG: hypothetical protein BECKMB1821I_GA0114274_100419 [Candidatus Kentron sp. MB]VFK74371.1 MAG: hypothetical protein BECKMB1821H_GA0114242_100419 [Candidatus Kentron sp. MB]